MSKGKRRKQQPQQNNKTGRAYKVTWAQAFRDVTNKAMARGQLLPIALLFITLLLIYKLPNEEVATLLDKLLNMLNQGEMWAYVLLVIICIGWYKHAKMMRKQFSAEYKRLAKKNQTSNAWHPVLTFQQVTRGNQDGNYANRFVITGFTSFYL